MTIKKTYIACDGVEFENEEDCLIHEADINKEIEILSECRFLDSYQNHIELSEHEHLTKVVDDVFYMYVASETAIRILTTLFEDYDVESPWTDSKCAQKVGYYAYLVGTGWVFVDDYLREIQNIIENLDRE